MLLFSFLNGAFWVVKHGGEGAVLGGAFGTEELRELGVVFG